MMSTQQMQQMMNDPQFMNQWHNTMMNNPAYMDNWMNTDERSSIYAVHDESDDVKSKHDATIS